MAKSDFRSEKSLEESRPEKIYIPSERVTSRWRRMFDKIEDLNYFSLNESQRDSVKSMKSYFDSGGVLSARQSLFLGKLYDKVTFSGYSKGGW